MNEMSVTIRVGPKGLCNLSLMEMATKSFGPVPASDSMTMVIPNERMMQPSATVIIRIAK